MKSSYLLLVAILLLTRLPALYGIHSTPHGRASETYTMWTVNLGEEHVIEMQAIPDVNGDGVKDLFVASRVENDSYLYIISGRNGSILRESGPLGCKIRGAVWVGGCAAVSVVEEIIVYGPQFQQLYTLPRFVSPTAKLQPLRGNLISLSVAGEGVYQLEAFRPLDGTRLWGVEFTGVRDCSFLATPGGLVACAFANESGWYVSVLDMWGRRLALIPIEGSNMTDRLTLKLYEGACFLYTLVGDSGVFVGCLSLEGEIWRVAVERHPENVGFTIGDANMDGVRDVVCVYDGNVTLLSGKNGEKLYSTGVNTLYVADLGATSEDGREVAVLDAEGYIHLLAFSLLKATECWVRGPFSLMEMLGDVDGDGFRDIVLSRGGFIACYWGHYDGEPPVLELVEPENATSTSAPYVTFRVKAWDGQSGVHRVVFVVDGVEHEGAYNPTHNVYEVGLTVTDGTHWWYAKAIDRAGHEAQTPMARVTVNTSLLGWPGWADDILFLTVAAAVLLVALYTTLREWETL